MEDYRQQYTTWGHGAAFHEVCSTFRAYHLTDFKIFVFWRLDKWYLLFLAVQ